MNEPISHLGFRSHSNTLKREKDHFNAGTFIPISILLFLVFLALVPLSTGLNEGGPKTVSGKVYRSDGSLVESAYNGANVELHIVHGGEESTYLDHNGLENSWYSITIEPGGWTQGDTYWIVVDGTAWGDIKGKAQGRNHTDTEWTMVGPGSHQLDIRTVKPEIEEEEDELNLEPETAFLSAIIILIVGSYIVGPSRKVNVDVIVISRKLLGGSGKPNDARNFEYEFGYGNPSTPVPIGKMRDLDEHLTEKSVVRVRVNGIIRTPDGYYSWFKPELLSQDRTDESPLLAPDSVSDLDRLWYATGCVKIERGQSLKSSVNRRFGSGFAGLVLPFIVIELAIGFYSFSYGYPVIPPFFGEGLMLNVLVILIGCAVPAAAISIGARAKRNVELLKKGNYTIRQWAILQPASGQGGQPQRIDLCGGCTTRIDQNMSSCPKCKRTFASSLEITPDEAKRILAGSAPGQKQALPPATTAAQTAHSAAKAAPVPATAPASAPAQNPPAAPQAQPAEQAQQQPQENTASEQKTQESG